MLRFRIALLFSRSMGGAAPAFILPSTDFVATASHPPEFTKPLAAGPLTLSLSACGELNYPDLESVDLRADGVPEQEPWLIIPTLNWSIFAPCSRTRLM